MRNSLLRFVRGLYVDTVYSEISLLEHLQAQIKQSNRWLIDVGKKDKRVKRLLTIPGIGRTIALLMVSEIDDIKRFRSDRKLHAYAGLIPKAKLVIPLPVSTATIEALLLA